jgi:maltokinase
MDGSLAELIASADPADLLPARNAARVARLAAGLRLVDVFELSPGLCVAIVGSSAQRYAVPLIVGPDSVRRARPGDGVAELLVSRLAERPEDTRQFLFTGWHTEAVTGESVVEVDQTNESVIVGRRVVLKWTVELSNGAEDGWDWAVADVRALARGELDPATALAPATAIGQLTGRLHLALAGGGVSTAGAQWATDWTAQAQRDLAEAVRNIDGVEGERLRSRQQTISAALTDLTSAEGTPMIEVHDDLHVGQVLRRRTVPTTRSQTSTAIRSPTQPRWQDANRRRSMSRACCSPSITWRG